MPVGIPLGVLFLCFTLSIFAACFNTYIFWVTSVLKKKEHPDIYDMNTSEVDKVNRIKIYFEVFLWEENSSVRLKKKISVEDYLNGIRSVSEIMVDLSIKKYTNYKRLDTGISKWGNRKPSVLLHLTIFIPVNLKKLKWFGSISTEGSVTDLYARIWNSCTCNTTKMGFRCIMPTEMNLGIMIPRGGLYGSKK